MFVKSDADKKMVNRLMEDLRRFYPRLDDKPAVLTKAMLLGDNDTHYWREYNENMLQINDPSMKEKWAAVINKMSLRFTPASTTIGKLPGPSFRGIVEINKNHSIHFFKSLVSNVAGLFFLNNELPVNRMTVDQQLKYVNHQLYDTRTSFMPNFPGGSLYLEMINEIVASVYPDINLLPPHLCQVEIDEIFYPGTSSIWDPAKTTLFYALFGEPGI